MTANGNKELESRRQREQHAYEYGCEGLLAGWALSRSLGKNVFAPSATKADGPFVCPACWSDAVLRKCTDTIDHFAHHARCSPAVGKGESELHLNCKKEILGAMQALYPAGKWEMERTFPANPEKKLKERRPGLSGYIENLGVVIEIQASALSITEILSRTSNYSRRKCHVLWIVPLKEELGDELFIPRLYERYFHSIYYGRTYYWLPGDGASIRPFHYDVASRYIGETSWYDVNEGEERTAGGYDRDYVIVKRPNPGPAVTISPHGLAATLRASFAPWNTKKSVPRCRTLQDRNGLWWDEQLERKRHPDYYRYDNVPL